MSGVLTCIPQSFFTWDYRVSGVATDEASVAIDFFSEQGRIAIGEQQYAVRKHGHFSGRWTLEIGGQIVAEAQKTSPMLRVFELKAPDLDLVVQAESAFTRCYEILSAGRVVGSIRPVHALTRQAQIECSTEVPEPVQLFAFWLAIITWRRAANA